MYALWLSKIVNTSPTVNLHFEHLALGGSSSWPGAVERAIRRRAARRLGPLGYAALLTRGSDDGASPRVELVRSRIEQLAGSFPPPRATAAERAAQTRRRRLVTWDVLAHAAMAAEDLEILLAALARWRSGQDLFELFSLVEARGPVFFETPTSEWPKRLRLIARFPSATELAPPLTAAEATLLESGLQNSVREASDDLYALASVVPWDVRLAMMPYKHGFTWLIPSVAPLTTDPIGLRRIEAAPEAAFIVRTGHQKGLIFTCGDDELTAALEACKLASDLEQFVCRAVLSESESKGGQWGVALYGESAADVAQRTLADRVQALLYRR